MASSLDPYHGPALGAELKTLSIPPGHSAKAYKLECFGGEVIYLPCSRYAMRLLVTGRETEDAFAVFGTGGSLGDPIGFHYHREAHDVFLCLKGRINVWAHKSCRTMEPGDFASVPPVRFQSVLNCLHAKLGEWS
jgi:quercetin dioxygenase-like cupin family protein